MTSSKIVSTALFLVAASAQAGTYQCREIHKEIRTDIVHTIRTVTIVEMADVTSSIQNKAIDKAYAVKVTVANGYPNQKAKIEKSFKAVAVNYDVNYSISAVKAEGVKIQIFLDEMDEAYIEMTNSDGAKLTNHLSCQYEE